MTSVYFDYNATAPLREEAKAAMVAALDITGNPSSVHAFGRSARAVVETAREEVAAALGATPAQVIFTSGASEANAWFARGGWDAVCLSPIEHESVYVSVKHNVSRVCDVAVSSDGVAVVEDIADHVLRTGEMAGRTAITLQMANNETGAVQPVAETAAFARAHGVFMHTDAVQAVGRLPVKFAELGVDAMSVSAHKFGGPKGIGALVLADDAVLPAMMTGGGQERRRRAGTENVAAIAGFGAAAAAASSELSLIPCVSQLRDALERGIKEITPEAVVISHAVDRLANTTCFVVPGKRAETLLIKLDLAGFAVSSGAACSSGKVGASRALLAMGLDPDLAQSALRISIGHKTTEREISDFLGVWRSLHARDQAAA